jgi:hypothetical protein
MMNNDLTMRVAKIEGAVGPLQWMLAFLAAIVLAALAFLGDQITHVDGRVEALQTKVDALPGQISSDLRDITKTLAEAITASKQQPPQVILVPTPAPPAQPGKQ